MRVHFGNHVFFVTNRCEQERFFMIPRPKLNKLIGSWLARALKTHGKERRAEGKGVLGVRRIRGQRWWMRPKNPSRRPRVKVFCRIEEKKEEYLEAVRLIVVRYREVYEGFLKASSFGRRAVLEWPPGCYPPSSLRPVAFV